MRLSEWRMRGKRERLKKGGSQGRERRGAKKESREEKVARNWESRRRKEEDETRERERERSGRDQRMRKWKFGGITVGKKER